MRTTVNIDDHLLAEAKVLAARQHRSLGDVIDDALRASFAAKPKPRKPISFPTFGKAGEEPLVDLLDKEAMAEVLGWNDRASL